MGNEFRVAVLILLALISSGAGGKKESRIPYGLMTEFIREPETVRILDLRPEFTWIVPSAAGMQTAWQILISSSPGNIRSGKGDVWDSGMIKDSRSVEVESGKELEPDMRYFWRVRVWDSSGKPSGYSEIQSFTTGHNASYATTQNTFLVNMNKPSSVVKLDEGHYLIDFGLAAFGTIVLEINPVRSDTLLVHLGEKLSATGKIDRKPGGSVRYQVVKLAISPQQKNYILNLPPDTRNTTGAAVHLPDSFGVIAPFRYCELENCNTPVTTGNIYQKAYSYYFDGKESGFTCSDTILNRIWDICKYTIEATSFTGLYIDGDRERIPYEADAYINQLGHYYTDREYSMGRASDEYFITHPTWPTEWILHTVLMFYNDIMFTGNLESAAEYYSRLKYKTLTMLAREDGLITSANVSDDMMKSLGFTKPGERIRDIVDWPPAQKDTGWKLSGPDGERDGYDMVPVNTVVNAFYYRNLVLMAKIADLLDKSSDSEFYRNEAEKVKRSFNSKLLDKDKGYYRDGENSMHSSLHANMMALAFDLVPDDNMRSVISFIRSRGMACSVYGSQYLLEGLYRSGESDYAYSLLTATNDRSWWNMIRSGSTMTMEAWDIKYKPNSDWNHAWGAAPANIIPGYMWGIAPAEPGFSKCVIKPQLGKLEFSRITVPTIRGPIKAEFRNTGKQQEFTISIPGNMECDLVTDGDKVFKLRPGVNKIKL